MSEGTARHELESLIEAMTYEERRRDTRDNYIPEDFKDGVERATRIAVDAVIAYFEEEERRRRTSAEQEAREQREADDRRDALDDHDVGA